MPWWMINPKGEPFDRKSAANAIAGSRPSSEEDFYEDAVSRTITTELSAKELADLYNTVEDLGIDLTSISRPPVQDITWDEEEDY